MVLEKCPSHVGPEESGSQIYPINDRYRLRVDQISEITDEQLVPFWRDVAERLSLALGEREEGPLGPFESPAGLQLKARLWSPCSTGSISSMKKEGLSTRIGLI